MQARAARKRNAYQLERRIEAEGLLPTLATTAAGVLDHAATKAGWVRRVNGTVLTTAGRRWLVLWREPYAVSHAPWALCVYVTDTAERPELVMRLAQSASMEDHDTAGRWKCTTPNDGATLRIEAPSISLERTTSNAIASPMQLPAEKTAILSLIADDRDEIFAWRMAVGPIMGERWAAPPTAPTGSVLSPALAPAAVALPPPVASPSPQVQGGRRRLVLWLESAEACEGEDVLGAVAELEASSGCSEFDLRVLLVHDMEEALEKAASTKTAKALLCVVANAAVAGRAAMESLQEEVDRATGARTDRSGKAVARQLGMPAPRPLRVLLYTRQDSDFDDGGAHDEGGPRSGGETLGVVRVVGSVSAAEGAARALLDEEVAAEAAEDARQYSTKKLW